MSTPDPPPAVLPWPLRPPRRVAGVPAGLLVCWQAALLLALAAIGRPAGTVIVLGVAAAVLVAATGLRPRGRWTHEWWALGLKYLLRAQRLAGSAATEPGPELALLGLATRVEAVDPVEIEEHAVAVISHRQGYTAVLELDPGGQPLDLPRLPLTLAPLADPEAPEVAVQLVLQPGRVRSAWLAVQVRREPGIPPAELRAALVSAVRRLHRRLRSERVAVVALDSTRLLPALHTCLFLDLAGPVPPGRREPLGTEQWDTWWTRRVPQQSLAIRSWAGRPAPPEPALFGVLLGPGAPRTVSLAVQRRRLASGYGALGAGAEVVAVELMVRLAGPNRAALATAVRQLTAQLAALGASVERLDGRQLPGLAGTLPLGGFLPGYPPAAAAVAPPPKTARAAAGPGRAVPAQPAPAPPVPPVAPPVSPPPVSPVAPPVSPAAPVPPVSPAVPAWPAAAPAGPVPAPAPAPEPEVEVPATAPARVRGHAAVPAALTAPTPVQWPVPAPGSEPAEPPVRGQAQVPATPAGPAPARGHAPVSPPPSPLERPTVPTALRGVTAPLTAAAPPSGVPPAARPPEAEPPAAPAAGPGPPEPPRRPEPEHAVRAYGASLFTAESRDRARMHRLLAAARTPQWSPQVVLVLAGRPGLGASTTAAGVARTLATVRDDHTALLGGSAGPADEQTIAEVAREHVFTLVDLGAYLGEATPRALAVSTRVLVVTAADRRATAATQLLLERIHQVHPPLAAVAVVAVVCRSTRQYRQVSRGLSEDLSAPAAQIVPIPYDPAVRRADQLDLTRLRTLTREAYLRLAAAVALPQSAPGAQPPAGGYQPAHPGGI